MNKRRLSRFGIVAVAALVLGAVLLAHVEGFWGDGMLEMCPAFVLAVALLLGRYPGEATIERWRQARLTATPRAVIALELPTLRSRDHQRGGRLIAVSLAGRAPPAQAGWR